MSMEVLGRDTVGIASLCNSMDSHRLVTDAWPFHHGAVDVISSNIVDIHSKEPLSTCVSWKFNQRLQHSQGPLTSADIAGRHAISFY